MNKAIVGAARSILLLFLVLTGGVAAAQCTWTSTTTTISEACGFVGIGTTSPTTALDVNGWTGKPSDVVNAVVNAAGDLFFGNTGSGVARARVTSNANQGVLQWNIYYTGSGYRSFDAAKPSYEIDLNGISDVMTFRRYPASTGNNITTSAALMTLTGAGNVGIGTTAPTAKLQVQGNAIFSGTVTGSNIQAQYQDVAEWVPATTDLEPGTLVVLNRDRNNEVMASAAAYDTTVAGVVSAQPGLLLGQKMSGGEQIATTGRVKLKVDARKHPIAVGDLLVSSDTAGKAMKSLPMEIGGRSFHQPGTIVGKALEPLDGGEGEILVLLSLQ